MSARCFLKQHVVSEAARLCAHKCSSVGRSEMTHLETILLRNPACLNCVRAPTNLPPATLCAQAAAMPLNVALLGAGIFAKDVYAKVFESTSAVQLKKASSSRSC